MTLNKKNFKYNGCYLDNMYEYQIIILIFEKHIINNIYIIIQGRLNCFKFLCYINCKNIYFLIVVYYFTKVNYK